MTAEAFTYLHTSVSLSGAPVLRTWWASDHTAAIDETAFVEFGPGREFLLSLDRAALDGMLAALTSVRDEWDRRPALRPVPPAEPSARPGQSTGDAGTAHGSAA